MTASITETLNAMDGAMVDAIRQLRRDGYNHTGYEGCLDAFPDGAAQARDIPQDVDCPGCQATRRFFRLTHWTVSNQPFEDVTGAEDDRAAATPPAPTPASEDGLIAAAMTLFDPMDHGSPSKPNAGHTPESFCAACVRVRAKRTQAIRRALVALGAMPSVSFRAATTERPAEPTGEPS